MAEFDELMTIGQDVATETFGSLRGGSAAADSILNWDSGEGGQDFHGTFANATQASEMKEAGYDVGFDGRWIGGIAQFTGTLPELEDVVTVGGIEYRVVQRTEDTSLELFLVKR